MDNSSAGDTALASDTSAAEASVATAAPSDTSDAGSTDAESDPLASLPRVDFAPRWSAKKPAVPELESGKRANRTGLNHLRAGRYPEAVASFLRALEADSSNVNARYNLACAYELGGERMKALALLQELAATAEACPPCVAAVIGAQVDPDFASAWQDPAFVAIVDLAGTGACDANAIDSNRNPPHCGPLWWQAGGAGCPPGAHPNVPIPEEGEGTFWCQAGGVEHGPYRYYELGYDMAEGEAWELGSYQHGRKVGFWSTGGTFHGGEAGHYVAGLRQGLWIQTEGNEWGSVTHMTYLRGKLFGRWSKRTFRLEHDALVRELVREDHYRDGKLHGPHRAWFEDDPSILEEVGSYEDGLEHGTWIRYGPTGQKLSEGSFENGLEQGTWIHYGPAGQKLREESFDRGLQHGRFRQWSQDGRLLVTFTMEHGTGDWLLHDKDGQLVERGRLVAGKKEGKWQRYDAKGALQWEASYRAGTLDGPFADHTDGQRSVGAYRKGRPHGAWSFDRPGGLSAHGAYVDGKLDGKWLLRAPPPSEHGAVDESLEFARGALVRVDGAPASRIERAAYAKLDRFAPLPLREVLREYCRTIATEEVPECWDVE